MGAKRRSQRYPTPTTSLSQGPCARTAGCPCCRVACPTPRLATGERLLRQIFHAFACRVSEEAGGYAAFLVALGLVAVWAVTGPVFHFSDRWQIVINTGTTVVTFLMVFLIQATQNRETQAMHLKLDELIRAQAQARNMFADLEHATERN